MNKQIIRVKQHTPTENEMSKNAAIAQKEIKKKIVSHLFTLPVTIFEKIYLLSEQEKIKRRAK